jgi:hypothetical protein
LRHTPQAKGRVERMNRSLQDRLVKELRRSLQDRLVKELRLRGISDIDAANAFAPSFVDDYKRQVRAASAQSARCAPAAAARRIPDANLHVARDANDVAQPRRPLSARHVRHHADGAG